LIYAIRINNIEIVKMIMKYAKENNIIFEFNDKIEDSGYSFLYAINNNNLEMIKLLMEYVNENNIVLSLKGKK